MKSGGLRKNEINKLSRENSPLLTIITVVRNGEQIIEETIESVLQQEYNNIEYIIIDGGSTDNTLEKIKKYENSIDLWISEPDKGIYDAMNKGISLATGQFVNFMNAGDKFYDSSVCSIVADSILLSDSDVVYGDFVASDKKFNSEIYVKTRPLEKIWTGMVFCHQSVFIKNKILSDISFNLNYKIVADFKQILTIYNEAYKFKNLGIPVSRIAIDGVSYSNMETIIETIKVVHSIKPYSFSILHFSSLTLRCFLRFLFGKKLTGLVRKYKWKLTN